MPDQPLESGCAETPRKKILTLLLIVDDENGRVLLGKKLRGFGAGYWNGFGGKVEPNESVLQGALRELKEEACVEALDTEEVGRLTFVWDDEQDKIPWLVHVFRATQFTGIPTRTDEMDPRWFQFSDIPYENMWADDEHWYPFALKNQKFEGIFIFRETTKLIEIEKIGEVGELTME
mmetsp:Transcript_14328/g.28604  ORF Transcript_14328/g.28604 Transcript_14328/m.28604 type:complete len:177 (+) Transcript_14328:102-632(+)